MFSQPDLAANVVSFCESNTKSALLSIFLGVRYRQGDRNGVRGTEFSILIARWKKLFLSLSVGAGPEAGLCHN